MTSPLTALTASTPPATAAAASSSGAPASAGLNVDPQMFLKLLVAQMKYQDPMNPMNGTEFISQSAQLSTVQSLQSIQTSQGDAARWSRMAAAQGMIGSQVSATDTAGNPVIGTVTDINVTSAGPLLNIVKADGTTASVSVDAVTSQSSAPARPQASATTTPTPAPAPSTAATAAG